MAATVGNERFRLRGRGAISEGISELKKRDCKIRQKLGRTRQEIRHFPVAIRILVVDDDSDSDLDMNEC